VKEIEQVIATMARIPPKSVSSDDKEALEHLERDLKRLVFGQDKAIEALSSAMKLSRAGLRDPEKPIGSLPVLGPDRRRQDRGRDAASPRSWASRCMRFDMSEYMERHTVQPPDRRASGLCRLRPGRSADRRDRPAAALRCCCSTRSRRRIPDLFNILLQVMDHGTLTDHQRQDGRLPQRRADHDDQCRCRRHGARQAIGFGAFRSADAGDEAVNKHVHAGVPQPPRCHRAVRLPAAGSRQPRGREVRHPARGSSWPSRNVTHRARPARPRDWLAEAGLRPRSMAPGRWPA
jgi:ATP-dependent Clp protease ATP-binding subunit ClpA